MYVYSFSGQSYVKTKCNHKTLAVFGFVMFVSVNMATKICLNLYIENISF